MEEMRRKDREVTELETVKEIIRQCAMCCGWDWPMGTTPTSCR